MRWNAIDPSTREFYRKPSGSIEWELTRPQAMRLSEGAIMVALDERNFNGSLNVYRGGRVIGQVECGDEWRMR